MNPTSRAVLQTVFAIDYRCLVDRVGAGLCSAADFWADQPGAGGFDER